MGAADRTEPECHPRPLFPDPGKCRGLTGHLIRRCKTGQSGKDAAGAALAFQTMTYPRPQQVALQRDLQLATGAGGGAVWHGVAIRVGDFDYPDSGGQTLSIRTGTGVGQMCPAAIAQGGQLYGFGPEPYRCPYPKIDGSRRAGQCSRGHRRQVGPTVTVPAPPCCTSITA